MRILKANILKFGEPQKNETCMKSGYLEESDLFCGIAE